MKKYPNIILSAFLSALFAVSSLLLSCENSFAAQSEKSGGISKGTTAFIMIAVFIATAVCTAFITFRIKKNKMSHSAESTSNEENKG